MRMKAEDVQSLLSAIKTIAEIALTSFSLLPQKVQAGGRDSVQVIFVRNRLCLLYVKLRNSSPAKKGTAPG
jgi:hypothetical protein